MRNIFVVAAIALGLGGSPALADSFELHGSRLILNLSNNSDAVVQTDSSLHGTVRVSGDNAGCLANRDGGGDTVNIDDTTCNEDLDHLTVDVPEHMPVVLTTRGSGNVTIGNLEAQLVANVGGNGDVHVGRVTGLVLNVTGSGDVSVAATEGANVVTINGNGDVKIPSLHGPLNLRQNGSGDFAVAAIEAPAVDLLMSGSGDTAIGHGSVGALHARISASGDLVVAATAATADLSATGGGDIRVAQVTGPVMRHSSGGSSITITGPGLERFGMDKLAGMAALSGDRDGETVIRMHDGSSRGSSGGSALHHLVAGAFVVFVIFMVWRMVQRRGGIGAVSQAIRAGGGPQAPSHPGVIAVRDTLARLEPRLARVEGYVTEREFELNRKFRDLETK